MTRFLILTLVLISAVTGVAVAETVPGPGDLPRDLTGDLGASLDLSHFYVLAGGAVFSALAYEFEDPDTAADIFGKGILDPMSDSGNIWGDARLLTPLALGAWALGALSDDHRLANTGYDATRGLILTYTVVGILKQAAARTRPNGASLSFPSGHTAGAFTFAAVVGRRYGGWPRAVTLMLGAMTAAGRMEDRKHFASDVMAGAAIGWVSGRTVSRPTDGDGPAFAVAPSGPGVSFSFAF